MLKKVALFIKVKRAGAAQDALFFIIPDLCQKVAGNLNLIHFNSIFYSYHPALDLIDYVAGLDSCLDSQPVIL